MKFTVCMKTPDALDYGIDEVVGAFDDIDHNPDWNAKEIKERCSKCFQDGETVWLEIDTDAMTCEVMAL